MEWVILICRHPRKRSSKGIRMPKKTFYSNIQRNAIQLVLTTPIGKFTRPCSAVWLYTGSLKTAPTWLINKIENETAGVNAKDINKNIWLRCRTGHHFVHIGELLCGWPEDDCFFVMTGWHKVHGHGQK